MSPQEITLNWFMIAVAGICALAILFFLAFYIAVQAQAADRKKGFTGKIDWYLYGRYIDWFKYRIFGPVRCFFRGHKIWKVFLWNMSGPGERYLIGSCSKCDCTDHLSHPIPMSDTELIAWLEDNHPEAYIIHLGSHNWPNHHKKGDRIVCVSSSGKILKDDGDSGRIDCFFHYLKAKRDV